MKLGILTFHRSTNNGAVIQCFSLSQKLKKDFPETEIEVIDYHMPRVDCKIYPDSFSKYYKGANLRTFLSKSKNLVLNPNMLKRQKEKNRVFGEAIKNLPLSSKKIYSDDTRELFDYINNNYDVVVVGSDAVWNYVNRGFPNPYFLDTTVTSKKFSYAASCFGMNYEAIPQNEKDTIKTVLDGYDFIGVRDDEAEKFVRDVKCLKTVTHTCDPTVLLDANDLPIDKCEVEKKLKNAGFDFNKKTIGIMGNDQMCKMVRSIYGKEYQIVSLFNYNRDADVNLYNLNPFEWAFVFRYFNITFTTYFHGTLLSLKNGTPVICIGLDNEYNKKHTPKALDVLKRLNMGDCYFNTDYLSKNINEIKQKADYLLGNDMKPFIEEQILLEAKSYDDFYRALKKELTK